MSGNSVLWLFEQKVRQKVNVVKQNRPQGRKSNFILIGGIDEIKTLYRAFGVNLLHDVHYQVHGLIKEPKSRVSRAFACAFNAISGEYMNDIEGYRFVIEKIKFQAGAGFLKGEANGEAKYFGSPFSICFTNLGKRADPLPTSPILKGKNGGGARARADPLPTSPILKGKNGGGARARAEHRLCPYGNEG